MTAHLPDNTNSTGVILQIVEENNYYPFGLKHKGYNNVITGRDHKYGYGNKEEQSELGLDWIDVLARNYDPALGRWMNVDPLAAKYYAFSPYTYTLNNPLLYIDPDGMRVANPVYGTDGEYRGDTSEGFTGVPIIYDGDAEFSTMTAGELNNNGGQNLNEVSFADGGVRDKIETHIANAQLGDGLDMTGEKITIENANIGGSLYRATNANSGDLTILRGRDEYSSSSNADKYFEPTVENLRNSINSHEINHTDCGLNLGGTNVAHRIISMAQMTNPQFSSTTERFQQFTVLLYGLNFGGNSSNLPTARLRSQFNRIYTRWYKWNRNEIKSEADVYNGR